MAFARANSTAWITSATPAQRAIAAGRRSNIPFQTLRASSYPGLSAVSTSPRSASVSWATAACGTPTLVVMRALLVSGSASSLSPHTGEAQERRGDDSAAEEVLDHDQRSRLPADLAVLADPRGGGNVAVALPGLEERIGVDSVAVAGVDLEVAVRRGLLGVAGAAHEAEHLTGLHLQLVARVGGERGEVRVEER